MAHSDYVTGPLDSEPNTILIVDDDPITRLVLGEIFKSSYDIQEAEDGREGLSLVLADPMRYCAILLDFAMEGMDGLEVLQNLVQRDLLARIPVFLITAETDFDVTRGAYDLGSWTSSASRSCPTWSRGASNPSSSSTSRGAA